MSGDQEPGSTAVVKLSEPPETIKRGSEHKTTRHAGDTEGPRNLTVRPPDSSWRRDRAAIRDRRAWGDYNYPEAITMTDAKGRWAVYAPLRVGGKIVVPDDRAH